MFHNLKVKAKMPSEMTDRDTSGRFLNGNQSGKGRKLGSRNRLSEDFLRDLHETWNEHGKSALTKCATHDASVFYKIVAGILPSKFETSLSVSLTADFEAARTFAEAWDIVKQSRKLIGASPIIDADFTEAELRDVELSSD